MKFGNKFTNKFHSDYYSFTSGDCHSDFKYNKNFRVVNWVTTKIIGPVRFQLLSLEAHDPRKEDKDLNADNQEPTDVDTLYLEAPDPREEGKDLKKDNKNQQT